MKTGELDGRVALVTGAGRGIGLEYARRLACDGVTTYLADVDGAAAEAAANRLRETGLRASGVTLDISDAQACVDSVNQVVEQQGSIDIVVNNAAIFSEGGFGEAEEIKLEDWRRLVDVNISGTYYVCRAIIPHMKRQGWGRIVNQGSTSAYTTVPRSIHYSMSKAAIATMTKTLARELGPFGITVNAIAPGMIDTEAMLSVMPPEALRGAGERASLGRVGHVEDLSPLISFLCTGGAGFITGQTIVVDGGIVMMG